MPGGHRHPILIQQCLGRRRVFELGPGLVRSEAKADAQGPGIINAVSPGRVGQGKGLERTGLEYTIR